MEKEADAARNAALMQRFDGRPDRGRDDEAGEEQRHDQPDLPQGKREHDDAYDDERRDERLARRIHA